MFEILDNSRQFGEFELFAASLGSKLWKRCFFLTIDLTLTLQATLSLKY